jgi:hypothetical protein
MNEVVDRHGRRACVGSLVRVLGIPPSLQRAVPADEWSELQDMVGEVLPVDDIGEGGVWVEKTWPSPPTGSYSHSIHLKAHDFEVVTDEP